MITRKFIEKVHNAFDELNYHETKQLNLDKFSNAAINTLIHSDDLSDAIATVRIFRFCLEKWKKIEKIFKKKLSIFNEYHYEGNSIISVVSDEDAFGCYYITNGISKKANELHAASIAFEDGNVFAFGRKKGRIELIGDSEYYLKYSKSSSVKMKLFHQNNTCLCNIVLSDDLGVFLEKNTTPYELIVDDGIITIYDRAYIQSLRSKENIDTDKMLASIDWDIIDKKSDFGVAKLSVYEPDQDIEMLLLFATSTFLVYHTFMDAQKAYDAAISASASASTLYRY